jgi:hypothetical protein
MRNECRPCAHSGVVRFVGQASTALAAKELAVSTAAEETGMVRRGRMQAPIQDMTTGGETDGLPA